jgi:regulator of protease activity HflC (stomatin/prohibitin superfamily)
MQIIQYKTIESSFGTRKVPTLTKAAKWLFGSVALILFFFIFCFRTVEAGQVGVVTRFGQLDREVEPGVALKLPWPIERLHKLDLRVQKEEVTAAAATADLQDANSTLAINYTLERGKVGEVYSKVGEQYKDRVIMPLLQSTFKNYTGGYTATDLIAKRPEVEAKTLAQLQKELDSQGIRIDRVVVVNFGFSKAFTDAIEAKQVAQQQSEQAKFLAIKASQEAAADIERAKGQAESQRLLTSTASSQSIELKQLEVQSKAIDKWNGVLPTTQAGETSLFGIPIK